MSSQTRSIINTELPIVSELLEFGDDQIVIYSDEYIRANMNSVPAKKRNFTFISVLDIQNSMRKLAHSRIQFVENTDPDELEDDPALRFVFNHFLNKFTDLKGLLESIRAKMMRNGATVEDRQRIKRGNELLDSMSDYETAYRQVKLS